MNWFEFLFFFVLTSGLLAILKLYFFITFTGAKHRKSYYFIYLLFTYTFGFIGQWLQSYWLTTAIEMLFLIGIGCVLLKASLPNAVFASIVSECVAQLAFGIINTIVAVFSPMLVSAYRDFGIYIATGSVIVSLLLTYIGFYIVIKRFHLSSLAMKQYFSIFLLPVLCVLLACGYISNTVYGNVIVMEATGVIQPGVNHWTMLVIQCVVGSLLFSTLYGCQKLSEGFTAQTRLALLEQEVLTQQDYLHEAHARYEQTQAFRHDIKAHLSALWGLLEHDETQNAKSYLEKLDNISEKLSFPCKTGNTVVDTLLSGKLSVARQNGIEIECTVKIPSPCAVDDLDLCVLFSNAVDNAIRACGQQESETKYIHISGKQKGDFFMIEIENSCSHAKGYKKGIGLSNIEAVAEKYHGAVTSEKQGKYFRLSVLLIISRSLGDISV